jgi:hypothetical protein
MSKDFNESLRDLELAHCAADEAAQLAEHHHLSLELAQRIVDMARSIDQAYAIAELMR